MKKFMISSALMLATASVSVPAVAATTIGTDENWKVGSANTAAAAAALDPTVAVRTPTNAEIPDSYARNRVLSKWISPDLGDGNSFSAGQGGSAPGFYNFLGFVSLSEITGVQTSVRYWADNALVSVLVNGMSIFNANPASVATQFGGTGTVFTFSGDVWKTGRNSIEFIVRNDGTSVSGNPTALMAEMNIPGNVPEPGTWMLMILGLGAVGFAMRRGQAASVRYQFA